MCGTSTVTTFVESASGVAEGGRTGLTSISSSYSVWTFPAAFTNLPGNSFLCHSTGSDRCRLSDADICYKD